MLPLYRPTLSATIDIKKDPLALKKLLYPYLGSAKLDGIRCTPQNMIAMSRNGKPLPSMQVQSMFGHLTGLDGELIVGQPTDPNVFNTTQSYVMSENKQTPELKFFLFDRFGPGAFEQRLASLPKGDAWLIPHPHVMIHNEDELLEAETKYLEQGYEGIMLRSPDGPYKQGRSTNRENYLLKLKRFTEDELVVVGFIEQTINTNVATVDALGYSERSTHKANMLPAGTLGKFVVSHPSGDLHVSCGCLNHAERQHIWNNRELYFGKTLVMRHFQIGLDGYRPRFGRFVGWRDDR